MHANKCSIRVTFSNHPKLQIPFFQRNYVWQESQWETFWETMCGVSESREIRDYFMGAIVLKQNSSATSEGDIRTVIDGQQRLITTFLFFKAVCQKNQGEEFFKRYFYREKFNPPSKKQILEVALDDKEVFNKIMENRIVEISDEEKKNKVYQCFEFFSKKDAEKIKNMDMDKMFDYVCFVVVDLDSKQDEQQIFDTLNSIGVGLTAADLVKNYLFRGREEEDIRDYKNYWKHLFEGENRKFWDRDVDTGRGKKPNIEVFFQAFFDLYNKEVQSSMYDKTGSLANRYKIYFKDKGIEKGSDSRTKFLNALKEYAEIYRNNINYDLISEGVNFENALDRINVIIHGMNTTTIIPYILYILKNVNNEKEKESLFKLIENYIIRRALCRLGTNTYNNFFPALVHRNCDTHEKLNKIMHKLMIDNNPHNRFPSDEQLWNSFDGQEGVVGNKNARAILYLVEQSLFDGKDATRLLSFNSYQIEHILPKKWDAHWKDFAAQINNSHERKSHVNRYVIKLGNLTILTPKLNESISNQGWEIKKKGRDRNKNKGLRECATNIKSFDNDEYLRSDSWDESKIDSRTKHLFNIIKTIWATPELPQN